MRTARQLAAAIVASALLCGCTVFFNNSSSPDAASLKGVQARSYVLSETGMSGTVYTKEIWEQFEVRRIDDRAAFQENLKIDPGPHRLVVWAHFNQADNASQFHEVWINLDVTLRPGVSYILNGRTTGSRLAEVWLEDAIDGTRASEPVMRAAPHFRPGPPTLVLPIRR